MALGERRRAQRLRTELDGGLSGRSEHPARIVDLSQTGSLVRVEGRLDAGTILDLAFDLGGQPFSSKVRVIECAIEGGAEPPGYLAGLEFLGLSPAAVGQLRSYLDAEKRRSPRADAASR